MGNCSMCHAREPLWDGMAHAPRGVYLETPEDVAMHARQIYLQAGMSMAMPPANLTYMDNESRAALVRWYEGAEG